MQREVAGDGDGRRGLLGGIGDALRGHGCGCGGREDSRSGVVAVQVDAAAQSRACRTAESPAHRGVGMPVAGDGGVEGLRGAEFDAGVGRRKRDRDVAGDGQLGGGRFGGVSDARSGDLHDEW